MTKFDAALAYGRHYGIRYLVVTNEGCILGGCKTKAQAEEMSAECNRRYEAARKWYGNLTAHVVEAN